MATWFNRVSDKAGYVMARVGALGLAALLSVSMIPLQAFAVNGGEGAAPGGAAPEAEAPSAASEVALLEDGTVVNLAGSYVEDELIVVYERESWVALAESDAPAASTAYSADALDADVREGDGSEEFVEPAISMVDAVEEELGTFGLEVVEEMGADPSGILTADEETDRGVAVVAAIVDGSSVEEKIAQLQQEPGIVHVQPNYVYRLLDLPAEPGLDAGSTYYQDYLAAAQVVDAWDTARCEGGVTVAVLDSGCRLDHEDLDTVLSDLAYDTYEDKLLSASTAGKSSYKGDYVSHGTHVCGIVGAEIGNEKGVAGASYNANVLPIKVFDNGKTSSTSGAYTQDIVEGFAYLEKLIEEGKVSNLRVVNTSFGYYANSSSYGADTYLYETIDHLRTTYGVLTVCAGGNGDAYGNPKTGAMYPSDFDICLSVTALEDNGRNAKWSDYNQSKDISAPGVTLMSTMNDSARSYANKSGTSMAAPVVAGVAALMWMAKPEMSVDEAVSILKSTATAINDPVNDRSRTSGSAGAVDAAAAVEKAKAGASQAGRGSTNVRDALVTMPFTQATYRGVSLEPKPVVSMGGVMLKEGRDYSLSYSNNLNVGTATMTIAGSGSFAGSVAKTFAISAASILDVDLVMPYSRVTYTGKAIKPKPTISYNGRLLVEGVDYTLSYSNNVAIGTARLVVAGKGNFTGSGYVEFEIVRKAASVKRLAGDTALDTMAKIAAQGFAKGSCDTVVVATMGGYWDALAASSLAGLHGCPVLLTSGSSLSDQAASEIRRLGARRAYIAGGAAAVSKGVESQIRAMGLSTERLAGDTAVGTAVEIYEEGVGSWGRTAVVATAQSYHDALAASPYAYAHAAPVFLTDSANELSADALAAVEAGGFESVVICGGRAAVSGSVESQLRGIGVRSVRRLSGDTAYETAAAVSAWALQNGMSAACVGVATGRDYYDALTGASLCGRLNAPLVLVGHGNASAAGFLRANRADVSQVYVFGGTAAVTSDEYKQVQAAVG